MQTIKITHLTGINKNKEEFFTEFPIKIGSSSSNNLIFEESTEVSPHHATLLLHSEKYALINHSEHGVFINNKQVEKVYIKDNIEIQLGKDGPIFRFNIIEEENIEQDFIEVDELLEEEKQSNFTEEKFKICSYCAEEIDIDSSICPYCSRNTIEDINKKSETKTKKKSKLPTAFIISIFIIIVDLISCSLCAVISNERFKNIATKSKNTNKITQQKSEASKISFKDSILPQIKADLSEFMKTEEASKALDQIKKQNKYYLLVKSEYNDDLVLILTGVSCALTTINKDGNFTIPKPLEKTIMNKGYDDLFMGIVKYVCKEGEFPDVIKKCLSDISQFPTYQTKATSFRNPTTKQNITINKPYNYSGLYLLLEPENIQRYKDFYNANNNKLLDNYTSGWDDNNKKVEYIFPFLNNKSKFLVKLKTLDPKLADKLTPKTQVIVDDTLYKLESYKFSNYIGNRYYGKSPDGKYLIIKLYVRNQSNSTRTIGLSSSTIVDSAGREYRTSSEGSTALTMSGDKTAEYLLTEIQPNIPKQITIVFDVSLDETYFKLKIPGKWGNSEVITIGE